MRNGDFGGIEDFRDPRVRAQHVQDWLRSLPPTLTCDFGLTWETAFELVDDLPSALFRELS